MRAWVVLQVVRVGKGVVVVRVCAWVVVWDLKSFLLLVALVLALQRQFCSRLQQVARAML